jgi:nitrite reductase (NADH) large subunit
LEGGIDYLKSVVIDDRLGICAELEADMARIIGTYRCEWKTTLENPRKLRGFKAFVNTDVPDPSIAFVREREQHRPATSVEKRTLLETKKIRLPVYSA